MVVLDRRKMEIATLLMGPIAFVLLIASIAVLIAFGTRPVSEALQFISLDVGAFLAFTLLFGSMYLEVPYQETDSKTIRWRQRGLIFCWVYVMIINIGVSWRLYQVG